MTLFIYSNYCFSYNLLKLSNTAIVPKFNFDTLSIKIFLTQTSTKMSQVKQLYINGSYCPSVKGEKFVTINPATDEPIAEVANATAEDIEKAVNAAKACLYSNDWGYKSTGSQRAVVLRKLGEIITSRKDEIAKLDSLDQGKPLREANGNCSSFKVIYCYYDYFFCSIYS